MKKTMLLVMAAVLGASCEKVIIMEEDDSDDSKHYKNVRISVNGDFGTPTFTRAALSADGKDMTDLWMFDYVGDELVQSIHQTNEDADFGEPNVLLSYGEHSIYFVASRGANPDLDEDAHTITWSSVKDTFWNQLDMEVNESSATDVDVTLERVVTKLKLNVNDKVPDALISITVTPEEWNYGMDYITGEPVSDDGCPITIGVPESYHGTTGDLSLSVFSISGSNEWTTDVSIVANGSGNSTLASISIKDAPLLANRATVYSGSMFSGGGKFTVSLDADWLSDKVLTW